jgi:uncharacterized protein (TIGR03435 family)
MRLRALEFLGVSAMVLAMSVLVSLAQGPDSPQFEVASIKTNNSLDRGGFLGFSSGQFRATNLPLRTLISVAYADPQAFSNPTIRLIGGPTWLHSDRFDIVAKPEGSFPPTGPPIAQQQLMLRSLLAERFALMVHFETRELPTYELVLARADGKLGPQLHKSEVDCVAFRASQRGSPTPQPLTLASPPPMCDLFGGFGRIAGNSTTIDHRSTDRPAHAYGGTYDREQDRPRRQLRLRPDIHARPTLTTSWISVAPFGVRSEWPAYLHGDPRAIGFEVELGERTDEGPRDRQG